MAEIAVEGEELHQTNRNQYDTTQGIISIKGLKGHDSANYKPKPETAQLLNEYMTKYTTDHPCPQPKVMAQNVERSKNQSRTKQEKKRRKKDLRTRCIGT